MPRSRTASSPGGDLRPPGRLPWAGADLADIPIRDGPGLVDYLTREPVRLGGAAIDGLARLAIERLPPC